jgi:diguanylate cyclase (GGDEF)-like protein
MTIIRRDITELKTWDGLESFNLVPGPVWVFDIDGYSFWWGNQSALAFWDVDTVEQLVAKDMSGDNDGARKRMYHSFEQAAMHGVCKDPWTAHPNGKAKSMIILHRAVLLGEEQHRGLIGFVNDVVDLGREPENLLLAEAMRYTRVAVTCYTKNGDIVIENSAASALYSNIKTINTDKKISEFIARFADQGEGEKRFELAQKQQEGQWEYPMRTVHGLCRRSLDIRMTLHPISSEEIMIVFDYDVDQLFNVIEELEAAKEELRVLANYDALTGLSGLRLFQENLTLTLAAAEREGQQVAIHFIDLDGFKAVNDTHGHAAGDEVLKVVGQRLTVLLRSSDLVARIGGDEFLLMQTNIKSPSDTQLVAQKIIQALEQPITIGKTEVTISASIGISIYPNDGKTSEELIKIADQSMYVEKRSGQLDG